METLDEMTSKSKLSKKEWWSSRRFKYNMGLIIAGMTAFVFYVIAGVNLIMPYDNDFEITLFTTAFQGVGYLFMILIANIFYNLGYWTDKNYNKNDSERFRQRLFNFGFWFSFGLPFLIPLLTVVDYFIEFRK